MKKTIPMRMLQEISRDFSDGRPIWGLLRCNEYLSDRDPLALAFRKKARTHLSNTQLSKPQQQTFEEVFNGHTLDELDARQIQTLLSLDSRGLPPRKIQPLPAPKKRRQSSMKTQLRRAGCPSKIRISRQTMHSVLRRPEFQGGGI